MTATRRRADCRPTGLDTSVAVPLLVDTHEAHREVVRWWGGREVALSGHAVAETYSARLLRERFARPLLLGSTQSARAVDTLARLGIAGGAVYDALVALAAVDHDAELATRDLRARATYEAVGARVVIAR